MTVKHGAKVRDYMTRRIITLSPDMEVMEAVKIMVENQISGAPVVDRFGTLVCMLSEKDCMRIVLNAGYYGEWVARVSEYMRSPVTTLDSDTSLVEAAELFAEKPYSRYPIVEDARLVGQISRSDVLRAIEQIAGSRSDLRTTIPKRED